MVELENIVLEYHLINYGGNTLREALVRADYKKLMLKKKVFDDLKLVISGAQIFGLLGINGAGKSSLLRIINESLPVNSGNIRINGKVSPIISMGIFSDPELNVHENIRFFTLLIGLNKSERKNFKKSVLEFCSFTDDELGKPLKTFSSGMRAKLNFAFGISQEVDVYLLDEIVAVADLSFQAKVVKKMKSLKDKGKLIIFVSHNLELIESLCDQVGIIQDGKLHVYEEPQEGVNRYRSYLSDVQ